MILGGLEEDAFSYVAVFVAEVLWGLAFFSFEGAVESGYAGEAAGKGDVGDGFFGVDEHSGGVAETDIVEEVYERDAGLHSEEAAEGGLCHIHQSGYFSEADGPAEMF